MHHPRVFYTHTHLWHEIYARGGKPHPPRTINNLSRYFESIRRREKNLKARGDEKMHK